MKTCPLHVFLQGDALFSLTPRRSSRACRNYTTVGKHRKMPLADNMRLGLLWTTPTLTLLN